MPLGEIGPRHSSGRYDQSDWPGQGQAAVGNMGNFVNTAAHLARAGSHLTQLGEVNLLFQYFKQWFRSNKHARNARALQFDATSACLVRSIKPRKTLIPSLPDMGVSSKPITDKATTVPSASV